MVFFVVVVFFFEVDFFAAVFLPVVFFVVDFFVVAPGAFVNDDSGPIEKACRVWFQAFSLGDA